MSACQEMSFKIEYGDVAQCQRYKKIECIADKTAYGSTWTAPNIDACSAGITAATCAAYTNVAACTKAGTRTAGQRCGTQSQCGAGMYCTADANLACGECRLRGNVGESCGKCATGLVCDFNAKCKQPGGVGAACVNGPTGLGFVVDCERGLRCVNGMCQPSQVRGGACSANQPCNFLAGDYCLAGVCVERTYVGGGQACDAGVTLCSAGECPTAGSGVLNICRALANEGEARTTNSCFEGLLADGPPGYLCTKPTPWACKP